MTRRLDLPKRLSLVLAAGTAALLPACAGPNRAQELAAARPAFVRVVAKYAAGKARREGCGVNFLSKAPGFDQRLRKMADLELTGSKLDRPQAEKLLTTRACALGADTLVVTSEDYAEGARGTVEATAYGFHSEVQILPSGLGLEADPKPLSCRVVFFRTKRPEAPYDELAGLSLNVTPGTFALGPDARTSQERIIDELSQAACHLGADAIVISQEDYDVPTLGSRVSGTAILFRENRERRPVPGTQDL